MQEIKYYWVAIPCKFWILISARGSVAVPIKLCNSHWLNFLTWFFQNYMVLNKLNIRNLFFKRTKGSHTFQSLMGFFFTIKYIFIVIIRYLILTKFYILLIICFVIWRFSFFSVNYFMETIFCWKKQCKLSLITTCEVKFCLFVFMSIQCSPNYRTVTGKIYFL